MNKSKEEFIAGYMRGTPGNPTRQDAEEVYDIMTSDPDFEMDIMVLENMLWKKGEEER